MGTALLPSGSEWCDHLNRRTQDGNPPKGHVVPNREFSEFTAMKKWEKNNELHR